MMQQRMVKRVLGAALLACATVASAGFVKPVEQGLELNCGTAGKLVLRYPIFQPAKGKAVKPVAAVAGDSVKLTYPGAGLPELTMTVNADDTVAVAAQIQTPGALMWDFQMPITFAGTGSVRIGEQGILVKCPVTLPTPAVFAKGNSNFFELADSKSGCRLTMKFSHGGYFQIQDNRAWKWKIFQLHFKQDFSDAGMKRSTIGFGLFKPETTRIQVDRFGQSTALDFPGKVRSEEELRADVELDKQYFAALTPPERAEYGALPGSAARDGRRGNGFFQVGKSGGRDWLVAPAGDLFFQISTCSVSPCDDYTYVKGREQIYEWLPKYQSDYQSAYRGSWATDFSYYLANRIRKTGKPYEFHTWRTEQIDRLQKWGFNSMGAFSSYSPVNIERKFAYTPGLPKAKGLIGDISDPFDPEVRAELDRNMAAIADKASDPAIIGYFIANEQPYRDVARQLPLFGEKVAAKRALVDFLAKRYGTEAAWNKAWKLDGVTFESARSKALAVQTEAAWRDMEEFTAIFLDEYFKMVAEAFRKYDKNHLLLGARFLPANASCESAVRACGKYSDVFSINYYSRNPEPEFLARINRLSGKPLLLSEWSFGTAEQGLAGGVIDVVDQRERGWAYRNYAERTAALPYVVGLQFFAYLDQALTGRFFQHYNGECMNIGLVNVADRPYKEFLAEVMKTNYRLYEVAQGKVAPFAWTGADRGGRAARTVQIPRALPGHRVDGIRSPWPGRPSERLGKSNLVEGRDDGGVSADFWLCWDDENLYCFVEVEDPTPAKNRHKGAQLWQSDCVELFVGREPEKEGGLLFGDRQVLLGATPGGNNWMMNQGTQPKIESRVIPHGRGYSLEVGIPWKALGMKPEKGLKLRFDVGLDDGDDGPRRLRQFMWSGNGGNSASRTGWGTATLVD